MANNVKGALIHFEADITEDQYADVQRALFGLKYVRLVTPIPTDVNDYLNRSNIVNEVLTVISKHFFDKWHSK